MDLLLRICFSVLTKIGTYNINSCDITFLEQPRRKLYTCRGALFKANSHFYTFFFLVRFLRD